MGHPLARSTGEALEPFAEFTRKQRVHLPRQVHLDRMILPLGIAVRRVQQHAVPLALKHPVEPPADVCEPRRLQLGNDQADGVGPACAQAGSGDIRAIIQLLHPLQNARLRLGADVGLPAKHSRDRHLREVQVIRNVLETNTHAERPPMVFRNRKSK